MIGIAYYIVNAMAPKPKIATDKSEKAVYPIRINSPCCLYKSHLHSRLIDYRPQD
jgi:hypothetical protein